MTSALATAVPLARPVAVAPLLSIRNLAVEFRSARGSVRAIESLDLDVSAGEILAIVGESGSGKSVTALSIMRLLPAGTALVTRGSVEFDGRDLLTLSPEEMRDRKSVV